MGKNRYAAIILFLVTALVTGCGKDEGAGVGPTGSSIAIVPSSIDYNYPGTTAPGFFPPTFVTVTLVNSRGDSYPQQGGR